MVFILHQLYPHPTHTSLPSRPGSVSAAALRRQAGRPTLPLEQRYEREKRARVERGGRGGRGGRGPAEKGSSISADKRKRIMICQEEKDGESRGGERESKGEKHRGKNRARETGGEKESER